MKTSPWAANMRNGVFFLAVAVLFGWQGIVAHDGGDWALSPALFPLLLAAGLALLALALVLQGVLHLKDERGSSFVPFGGEISMKKAVSVFSMCIAYALFLPFAGFLPSTVVFLAAFSLLAGERRLWLIAVISLLSPAVIYAIFRHGLKVLLP
jgi:putative tricarboxylic transport membrane protein